MAEQTRADLMAKLNRTQVKLKRIEEKKLQEV